MNFVKQIERLQLLNKLIREENTGSPEELAGRLGLSRRRLYDVIEDLQCWGAQVSYDRRNHTFCYTRPFDLNIRFSLSVMADDEVKKIFGGSASFSLPCNFSARSAAILDFH